MRDVWIVVVAGIMLGASSIVTGDAFAELTVKIDPYVEGNGFVMGYAYACGDTYEFAEGLTILTVAKDSNGNLVSSLGYYDLDYDLVAKAEYYGNDEVMQSIYRYWDDRQLSSDC
jgi:hypothetical protein